MRERSFLLLLSEGAVLVLLGFDLSLSLRVTERREAATPSMQTPGNEEADEEPKLKYVRLGASVFDILQKDSATCMAVHEKFLALGTNWGVIYIIDITGHEIKRFAAHSACVNELCLEETGECTLLYPPNGRKAFLFHRNIFFFFFFCRHWQLLR